MSGIVGLFSTSVQPVCRHCVARPAHCSTAVQTPAASGWRLRARLAWDIRASRSSIGSTDTRSSAARTARSRLLAARDRFGIRALFCADVVGTLGFASEVKALLAAIRRGGHRPRAGRALQRRAPLDCHHARDHGGGPGGRGLVRRAALRQRPGGRQMRAARGGASRAHQQADCAPAARPAVDATLIQVLTLCVLAERFELSA